MMYLTGYEMSQFSTDLQDQQREDWLFLLVSNSYSPDFSATSDETALEFALAEFKLLQLLTEGPSPELPPALLLRK